jgi:hypothetical protein
MASIPGQLLLVASLNSHGFDVGDETCRICQRAKAGEVKQFAEKMVQDHSQFLEQLERITSSNGEGN